MFSLVQMVSKRHIHISFLLLVIYFVGFVVSEAAPLLSVDNGAVVGVTKSCKRDMANKGDSAKATFAEQHQNNINKLVAEIPCAPVNHQIDSLFAVYLYSNKIEYTEPFVLFSYPYINVIENPPTVV